MLEKAAVPYVVLERSTMARMPLEGGGVIIVTPQIQPLLKQLGLLEEVERVSKPIRRLEVFEADQPDPEPWMSGMFDSSFSKPRYGYDTRVISRPELYSILVDAVPASKVLLGKQISTVQQVESQATCECTDGSSYTGIVVGADGAYSAVRLDMYRQLKEQDLLPAQDRKPMQYRYQALVGMTRPLMTQESDMAFSQPRVVIYQGKSPFTFWSVPMTMNRMCWMLDRPIGEPRDCPDMEDLSYHPEVVQEMVQTYSNASLQTIFDATPDGTMLALPREEASFSTWSFGKIVLMGDACHKVIPYGGQSMVQAGYDAAALANIFYAQKLDPSRNIVAELAAYGARRQADVKDAVKYSHYWSELFFWQGWFGRLVRRIVLNHCPQFLLNVLGDRLSRDRPQVVFLPKIL
ncbi:hypothetical protein EMPS_00841 [Entomortierella parvispora]|uniref:FAD-binding domain-containing protein n=1 Tax=Entomortierella parvispora TaxID=205924 RepID=A0A9P3H1U0_9FUNG|nr:hypothetical protein EMPS_00841 [Entomortierella parvispora]